MKHYTKFIFVLFCLSINPLIVFADAEILQEEKNNDLANPEINLIDDQDAKNKEDIYKLYTQANYFHTKGDANKTMQLYKEIFSKKPPIFVFEGYFRFLFDVGQIAKIVEIYQKNESKFKKFFEKNLDFNMLIAQALLAANQDDMAEKIFVALAKDFPDNEQVAYYFTVSLIKNNQFDKALAHLNDCLKKPIFKSRYFLFHFLRSKIYMQLGKNKEAMQDIEKSLEQFPHFDKAVLLKAMLQEQLGMINEAIKGYQHFLNIVGRDEMIEKQMIQLLFSQNRMPEAMQYMKKLKGNSPEYFFDLAMIEFNSKNYKKALDYINTSIQKSQTFTRAKLLKIEILLAMKDHNQILIFMRDWLTKEPYDNSVIHTLLLLSRAGVSQKHIIGLLEDVVKANKATVGVWAALADLLVSQKNYKQGIIYYKKIFDAVTDPDLKSKVLYQVAHLYFLTNQPKNMENILLQALKYPVVYPDAYNMLAYSYAKKGQNLDKALEYADKALQSDANSASYLDTKGLILFKMGKNEEALELLEKALTISPADAQIIEHIQQIKSGLQVQNNK